MRQQQPELMPRGAVDGKVGREFLAKRVAKKSSVTKVISRTNCEMALPDCGEIRESSCARCSIDARRDREARSVIGWSSAIEDHNRDDIMLVLASWLGV